MQAPGNPILTKFCSHPGSLSSSHTGFCPAPPGTSSPQDLCTCCPSSTQLYGSLLHPAAVCSKVSSVSSAQTPLENHVCITLNTPIPLPFVLLHSTCHYLAVLCILLNFSHLLSVSPTLNSKQREGRVFVHCSRLCTPRTRAASDTW